MDCELCGQKPAVLISEIEGTMMNVCKDCAKFGSIKNKKNIKLVVIGEKQKSVEPNYIFVENYGLKLKKEREKLGLKQEEMAKRLNIRSSLLHQIESQHLKPSIDLARKLERELKIKILEEIKNDINEDDLDIKKNLGNKKEGLTLGDFIKKG
ncbi:MAG: multiprotein-bridging factor 1 family protein [Candidatus Woesearchaeota archaeon]